VVRIWAVKASVAHTTSASAQHTTAAVIHHPLRKPML
jgi:hypothetical protein